MYHDIIDAEFNLDHVVVNSRGIFVIETKAYSKPKKEKAEIKYDGKVIHFGTERSETKPINQVRAGCKWIRKLLKDYTGKDFPTKGMVVLPGWNAPATTKSYKHDVWVINPAYIQSYISSIPDGRINDQDLNLVNATIRRHIQNFC